MTHYTDSKYKIFRLDTLPPALFGETYVVAVAVHTPGPYYKGEHFVLSQRPAPALHRGGFKLSADGIPEDFLKVDLDYILQESQQQAEVHLIDRLIERSIEFQRPDIQGLNIRLIECTARPFVGCWLRGAFHEQIREVTDSTECAGLATYLEAVSQMKAIQGW